MTVYLLAGGGTAGHVNPLLAVADAITADEPEATVLVLGTQEGLEARLVPERGYRLLTIPKVPFPRRADMAAVRFPARLREAVRSTRALILEHGVDAVVGFGGFAAAPAYLAVKGTPASLSLHEANARPGLANRLGAQRTPRVGVAFPGTRLPGATVVGMPLRPEIVHLDRRAARAEALELFGLSAERRTLLVTGGSQGARRLNETIAASAAEVIARGWQILHLTGERSELADPGMEHYRIIRYCDRMELALGVADAAVSRSGAATVSELTALGIPAFYVPYPVGNGEQRFNAAGSLAAGASLLVADAAFTPDWVRGQLLEVLGDAARLEAMAEAASGLGILDGSERMLALIRSGLGPEPRGSR